MHCFLNVVFVDFGVHFGCHHSLQKTECTRHFSKMPPRCLQDASKTPQERPKSAPRGPKSDPRAAKSDPRLPQDTSRAPQKPPKRTQPCPKERKNRKSCRKATIIGNNAEKPSQKHLSYQKICSKGRVLQCRVGEGKHNSHTPDPKGSVDLIGQ